MTTTVYMTGGPPLTDGYGVAWRLNAAGQVTANGTLDQDHSACSQLVLVNNVIWRQVEHSQLWSWKTTPGDVWKGNTSVAPISTPVQQQLAMAQILAELMELKHDFDAYKNSSTAVFNDLLTSFDEFRGALASAAALNAANASEIISLLNQILAITGVNQTALVKLLNDILAALTSTPPIARITGGTPTFSVN